MTSAARRDHPARYADLAALPGNVVGEILGGELHVSPRPASRHALSSSNLGAELNTRLRPRRGGGGPSSAWWILDEPELHLGDDVLVPDLAGWRAERMPEVPDVVGFTLAPDWVCEVLSSSTQRIDRVKKMPIYTRAHVGHVWLVDPIRRSLDVFALKEGQWTLLLSAGDDDKVTVAPFEALEVDLGELWPPTREQPQPSTG